MIIEVLTAIWKKKLILFFFYLRKLLQLWDLIALSAYVELIQNCAIFDDICVIVLVTFIIVTGLNLNVICYDTMWNKNWYCFFSHLTYNFHDNIYNFTKLYVYRTIFQYYDYNYNGKMTEIVIFPLAESSV